MLVPLSWLRDFAPFDDDPVALAETFDNLGMVVEGIRHVGAGLGSVVVAKVLEVERIAGADRIRRVVVDDGTGAGVQVVCGAWNFEAGATVAFARVGAVLPGDFQIGRRKMKGVESNGMICSVAELELGDDHAGIMVLPDGLVPGTPLAEALGIEADVVFDLAIETNRPDAMCVAGVARDAAAKLGLPFALPDPPAVTVGPGSMHVPEIHAAELCTRFTATVFEGVAVGDSPEPIARRLRLAGMRPINDLVDASNYVMLELGQPTHPYDLHKLAGGGLLVRAAAPGESVVTLDGVERVLGKGPTRDCLICDADGAPVGIGGIMGGASSEIDARTTTVLLEAAHFDRMAIAHTSKRLGLRSEASARFERGVDPEGIERCVARYAELIGSSASSAAAVGEAPPRARVRVRTARVNALLGTQLDADAIAGHLEPIGFAVVPATGDALDVTIPSFRPDASIEEDVIEEVARHHGYDRIARTVPTTTQVGALTPLQRERRLVRQVLAGAGLSEAMAPMLIGPGDHERAGLPEGAQDVVRAADPLMREESVLRTSLLPGLLRALAYNASHREPDVALFELGHVYPPPRPGDELPAEEERVAWAIGGEGASAEVSVDVLLALLDALRVDGARLAATSDAPGLHPTRTASVVAADGTLLGWVGEVDPDVVAAHGVAGRVGWADISLERLHLHPRRTAEMRPVSRYPSTDIDLAFVVPDPVPAGDVEATLRATAGDLLERLALFDVFRASQLGDGVRSLAYRLRFRAPDRTMTDEEVAGIRARCIAAVERHGASLRG